MGKRLNGVAAACGSGVLVFAIASVVSLGVVCLGHTVIVDEFGDSQSGWLVYQDASTSLGYEAGTYVVEVNGEGLLTRSWAPLEDRLPEECAIAVCCALQEQSDGTCGLIVGTDDENYVLARISAAGWYSVELMQDGAWQSPLVPPAYGEAIDDTANLLSVELTPASMSFSVNGETLVSAITVPFEALHVGITAQSHQEDAFRARFDSFELSIPTARVCAYDWIDPPLEVALEASDWAYAQTGVDQSPTDLWYSYHQGVFGAVSASVGVLTPIYTVVLGASSARDLGDPQPSATDVAETLSGIAHEFWIHVWFEDPPSGFSAGDVDVTLQQGSAKRSPEQTFFDDDTDVSSFVALFEDPEGFATDEPFVVRLSHEGEDRLVTVKIEDMGYPPYH